MGLITELKSIEAKIVAFINETAQNRHKVFAEVEKAVDDCLTKMRAEFAESKAAGATADAESAAKESSTAA